MTEDIEFLNWLAGPDKCVCPRCHYHVEKNNNYCPNCRQRLKKHLCLQCNHPIEKIDNFCSNCGQPISL